MTEEAPGLSAAELQEQLRIALQQISDLSIRLAAVEAHRQGGADGPMPYLQLHQGLELGSAFRRAASVPTFGPDGQDGLSSVATRLAAANGAAAAASGHGGSGATARHPPSSTASPAPSTVMGEPDRCASQELEELEVPMAVSASWGSK